MTQSGSSWTATVNLPQSTAIQYKYIQKDASGTVTWESGSNHTATTGSGGATASLTDQLNGTTATPPPAPTVAVTFNENETTTWGGSNVYVVGSIPALGSWNTGAAIKMDPASYPRVVHHRGDSGVHRLPVQVHREGRERRRHLGERIEPQLHHRIVRLGDAQRHLEVVRAEPTGCTAPDPAPCSRCFAL